MKTGKKRSCFLSYLEGVYQNLFRGQEEEDGKSKSLRKEYIAGREKGTNFLKSKKESFFYLCYQG